MVSLPPFLMTSEKNSFAKSTIEERKPLVLNQILADYDCYPSIQKELIKFREELKTGIVLSLEELSSDREIWNSDAEPWIGKSWLDVPWFFAETYFFRRILEIVKYFQPGPLMHQDPFQRLKNEEIFNSLTVFSNLYNQNTTSSEFESFAALCYRALWGNRGDLSNLNVLETDMGLQKDRIIINHIDQAYKFIKERPRNIGYIFDNVGRELFFDLAFIDYLLDSGLVTSVTCFLKNQPFFVSDAMPKDLFASLRCLQSSKIQQCQSLGKRLQNAIDSRVIKLEAPSFFTSSKMFRKMPNGLRSKLSLLNLTILKGDLNYRRLFGDRHWKFTTSIQEAGGYFPSSFICLRTLKSEIALGLSPEKVIELEENAEDDWMVNGMRGMVIFHQK